MKQAVRTAAGAVSVVDVPAPVCGPGMALVRVRRSAISPGTEGASISGTGTTESLVRRAIANPALVKQVLDRARHAGVSQTLGVVRDRLGEVSPIGYSCAGVVVEVGEGVPDLAVGERVACAGVGYANHAEFVAVPFNLLAKVPENVSLDEAAFATLGAIAMHGVRQLEPALGDSVVVVGLGIIGQLAVQLLTANGCRVIGADLEPVRAKQAVVGGAIATWTTEADGSLNQLVLGATDGVGADGVLLAAASTSSSLINDAFAYTRDRGRVVIVGDVGLDLKRPEFFRKEIELRISRSYGPGRYDASYEEGGLDYPIGYVRWTEQRNLACFLDLVAQRRVNLADLIDTREPIDRAPAAYEQVRTNKSAIGVVLEYGDDAPDEAVASPRRRVSVPLAPTTGTTGKPRPPEGAVRIGVIGAGGFFKAVHLPNLKGDARAVPVVLASRSPTNARMTAMAGGFASATSDWREVIDEPSVNAVLIMTRHHQHAEQTLAALAAGKHVFVEKPLAITAADCRRIVDAQDDRVVIVGFNRRYAPAVIHLRQAMSSLRGPKHVLMRVNAGRLSPSHWAYGPEGGGRVIGEGCHFFDLLRWLVASVPRQLTAAHTEGGRIEAEDKDNLSTIIEFEDGSVATLVYATSGSSDAGKERLEVYGDGASIVLDDFRTVAVRGIPSVEDFSARRPDKGHRAILGHFLDAARGVTPPSMTAVDGWWAQALAEAAIRSAAEHRPVALDDVV